MCLWVVKGFVEDIPVFLLSGLCYRLHCLGVVKILLLSLDVTNADPDTSQVDVIFPTISGAGGYAIFDVGWPFFLL